MSILVFLSFGLILALGHRVVMEREPPPPPMIPKVCVYIVYKETIKHSHKSYTAQPLRNGGGLG